MTHTEAAIDGPVEASGFLFIGDVHLSSRAPLRRKDADYAATVFDKLEQAINIANENDLVAVILADLFDRPREPDESVKTRLLRLLSSARYTPVCGVGNHEIQGARLADTDTLAVVAASGKLIVTKSSGPVGEYLLGGIRIGLGCTHYGQDIPREVRSLFPKSDAVIWITHHDIAFEGAYPGSTVPFEIGGCALVVNGHMHLYKPPVPVGQTTWFNPGSLVRTKIDQIAEEPSVWSFVPRAEDTLSRHGIRFEQDVFDLTGRLIPAADGPTPTGQTSSFVDALEIETAIGDASPAETPDAVLIAEELDARFERLDTPEVIREAIKKLLVKVKVDVAG